MRTRTVEATRHLATRPGRRGRATARSTAEELVVEEPLEIRVEGQPVAITMRTPGDDLDLVIGFLRTEGVLDGIDDVRAVAEVGENTVDVRLAEGVPPARARSADRALYATSSCGVCGKASLDRLLVPTRRPSPWTPEPALVRALPERLRAAQAVYARTGGLHAAALFDARGELWGLREDVGRHNAVDKVLGALVRADREPAGETGLVVSSRAGFEIIQKALVVGLPAVVTLGAATTLAVEAARAHGLYLATWAKPEGFVVLAPTGPAPAAPAPGGPASDP